MVVVFFCNGFAYLFFFLLSVKQDPFELAKQELYKLLIAFQYIFVQHPQDLQKDLSFRGVK